MTRPRRIVCFVFAAAFSLLLLYIGGVYLRAWVRAPRVVGQALDGRVTYAMSITWIVEHGRHFGCTIERVKEVEGVEQHSEIPVYQTEDLTPTEIPQQDPTAEVPTDLPELPFEIPRD